MGSVLVDLVGKRFHRLLVTDLVESKAYGKYKKRQWKCLCDCGNISYVITSQLTRNSTKSCGCLHNELSSKNSIKSRHKIVKHIAPYNSIYNSYKSNALARKYIFELSKDDFIDLLNQNCYYCGIEPSAIYDRNYYHIKYNGIDRLDNKKGYTKDNSVTCCKFCNIAKNNNSLESFNEWVQRLSNNYLKKIKTLLNDTQRRSNYQEADSRVNESFNTGREINDIRTPL